MLTALPDPPGTPVPMRPKVPLGAGPQRQQTIASCLAMRAFTIRIITDTPGLGKRAVCDRASLT
jgi:hypothetical protein